MMRTMWLRAAMTAGILLGLAGCVTPSGPIFGDWTGRQPTSLGLNPTFVNLVLHGSPEARAGSYAYQATMTDTTFNGPGGRTLSWDDRWTLSPAKGGGAPMILVLHNLPGGQIDRYALLGNGVLVPLTNGGAPDTSQYGLHYALVPVSKSSWGYGRV